MNPGLDSASSLARALREGAVSSAEIVELHLERIRRFNPALNAVVTLDEKGARLRAAEADRALAAGTPLGPLHGVPITIKDAFETAGLRTTGGYPPFADNVPERDAPVVARLRSAGAIILGKTNLPPLASGNQTVNAIFGRTNNPWNLACTPGGSSGGSAVAIAAGLSALELGSDVGGSIRGPAHLCGVYGLKTTGGRLPLAGNIASASRKQPAPGPFWDVMSQFPTYGPLARSVPDLRLALRVLDGAAPGETGQRSAASLRIAWTDDVGGHPIDPEIRRAMAGVASSLAAAGARVERHASPGFDWTAAWDATGRCIGAFETQRNPRSKQWLFKLAGALLARAMGNGPVVRAFFAGARMDERTLAPVFEHRLELIAAVDGFLEDWDVWMCPAMPVAAYPHSRPARTMVVAGHAIAESFMDLTFSGPFNLTGHPAVVVPVALTAAGLPVGAQLVGRRNGEAALLDAAEAVDRIVGGYRQPPGY